MKLIITLTVPKTPKIMTSNLSKIETFGKNA